MAAINKYKERIYIITHFTKCYFELKKFIENISKMQRRIIFIQNFCDKKK